MTAVEWLYNNLKSHFEHDGDLLEVVQFSFDQAKEIEKQQIQDAMDICQRTDFYVKYESSEQYYKETFNNK